MGAGADEPARPRMLVRLGPACAEQGRLATGCARSDGWRLICGRATRPSCGVRVVLALALSCSPASSSTSTCRSSTSTRSTRCRPGRRGVVAVPVALIVAYGVARVTGARLQRAAQRGLRQGRAARRPPGGAVGLPPYPRPVAALSSRPPHRRAGARGRARHRRHRVPAVLHAVQRRADNVRDPAGLRRSCGGSTIGRFAAVTFATIVVYIAFTFVDHRLAGRASAAR